jgi:hypothetical protein
MMTKKTTGARRMTFMEMIGLHRRENGNGGGGKLDPAIFGGGIDAIEAEVFDQAVGKEGVFAQFDGIVINGFLFGLGSRRKSRIAGIFEDPDTSSLDRAFARKSLVPEEFGAAAAFNSFKRVGAGLVTDSDCLDSRGGSRGVSGKSESAWVMRH